MSEVIIYLCISKMQGKKANKRPTLDQTLRADLAALERERTELETKQKELDIAIKAKHTALKAFQLPELINFLPWNAYQQLVLEPRFFPQGRLLTLDIEIKEREDDEENPGALKKRRKQLGTIRMTMQFERVGHPLVYRGGFRRSWYCESDSSNDEGDVELITDEWERALNDAEGHPGRALFTYLQCCSGKFIMSHLAIPDWLEVGHFRKGRHVDFYSGDSSDASYKESLESSGSSEDSSFSDDPMLEDEEEAV